MKKYIILIIAFVAILAIPAKAQTEKFFGNIKGEWAGHGEVIAGKYRDTKFHCSLRGIAIQKTVMEITGRCRVGPFAQPINAIIRQSGNSFEGEFLQGAQGNGLDIVAGKIEGKKMIIQLNRKKLTGAMVVNHKEQNKIDVSISVRLKEKLIPIIGLTLNRKIETQNKS